MNREPIFVACCNQYLPHQRLFCYKRHTDGAHTEIFLTPETHPSRILRMVASYRTCIVTKENFELVEDKLCLNCLGIWRYWNPLARTYILTSIHKQPIMELKPLGTTSVLVGYHWRVSCDSDVSKSLIQAYLWFIFLWHEWLYRFVCFWLQVSLVRFTRKKLSVYSPSVSLDDRWGVKINASINWIDRYQLVCNWHIDLLTSEWVNICT